MCVGEGGGEGDTVICTLGIEVFLRSILSASSNAVFSLSHALTAVFLTQHIPSCTLAFPPDHRKELGLQPARIANNGGHQSLSEMTQTPP